MKTDSKKGTQGLEPNAYGAGLRRKFNTPWSQPAPRQEKRK